MTALLVVIVEFEPSRVWLFGSRGRATHGSGSDIDLAVEGVGDAQWPLLDQRVRENDVTLLPIDLVRWQETSPALRRSIETEGRLLYEHQEVPA